MLSRHENSPLIAEGKIQTSALESVIADRLAKQTKNFTISTVLSDWLRLDPAKVTLRLQVEVGNILRMYGCSRIEKRNDEIRFWYVPPANIDHLLQKRPSEPVLITDDPLPLNPREWFWISLTVMFSLAALLAGGYCIYQVSQKDNPETTHYSRRVTS